MIDTPQITETERQLAATLRLTIPREEIRNVMGPGLMELSSAVAAQVVEVTGPWFTHHLRMDPDIFDYEICLPVSAAIAPAGRVQPGEWPKMKVARTVHRGPYEELGEAWSEFDDWIAAQGLRPAEDLWERYLVDPSSNEDPASWQTELNRPLLA